MKKIVVFLFCLCCSFLFINAQPKREFRATWLTTVWAIDWPKTSGSTNQIAELKQKIATLKNANLNATCFQVRSMCDAMYNSAYEPWSKVLTGTRGVNPGYDPLAVAITEAHNLGIELHAWLNPYRYESTAGTNGNMDIRKNHPDWLLTYSGGSVILDPGNPEVVTYIANIVKDILLKYDVDGILFDDYFYAYEGTPSSLDAASQAKYKPAGMSLSNWRRSNINSMVAAVYNVIQSTKPWVRFGVSPFGIWTTDASVAAAHQLTLPSGITGGNMYEQIYCDPVAWMKAGTVDYISPQLYWPTTSSGQDYDVLCPWWSNTTKTLYERRSDGKKIHFYSSMTRSSTTNSESNLQVERTRVSDVIGAPGHIFYNTTNFLANNYPAELVASSGKFYRKALVPPITWKNHPTLPAPTNLNVSGTSMTWQYKLSSSPNTEARFSIYCYPKGTDPTTAMANPAYLLGMSYSPSFTLSSSYNSSYTYAVCTMDRYGNEFGTAFFNAPSNVTVTTGNATNIAKTSATLNGSTNAASGDITEMGFQWRLSSASTYNTLYGTYSDGNISASLTGLTAGTSYTFRAFVTTSSGTVYGGIKTFTTTQLTPPTVVTGSATNVTETTANLSGTITAGDEAITGKGFQYKVSGGNYASIVGTLSGTTLSASLSSLMTGTTYTYRAYATTNSSTYYGSERTFTTIAVVPPTVTTNDASNVEGLSATLNGDVVVGSEALLEKGFEWKTTVGGTYTKISGVLSGTTMMANLSGLQYSTGYTFRAYAKTATATHYGVEKTFITTQDPAVLEGTVNITEIWNKPIASTNYLYSGNIQRSMAYYDGKLYIPKISTEGQCDIINASTGNLSSSIKVENFDNKWNMMNVAISNDGQIMFGSSLIGSYYIRVNFSNRVSGGLSDTRDIITNFGRSDYFYYYGDFHTSTGGYLLALSNTSNKVIKVPAANGVFGTPVMMYNTSLPTGSSSKAFPINETEFFAHTIDFLPTMHISPNGTLKDAFGGSSVNPSETSGIVVFTFKGRKFMVIPASRYGSIEVYDITNGMLNAEKVINGTANLGSNANDSFTLGLCANVESDRVMIYVLAPNNGLAAYALTIYTSTVDNQKVSKIKGSVYNTPNGIRVEVPEAAMVEIYDIRGVLVKKQHINSTTEFALRRGAYIVKIDNQPFKVIR